MVHRVGDGQVAEPQARRVIEAVSIGVQLMCRAGVDDEAALERVLATGCARFNLGRSALTDLRWCATAIARHGERIGVSLPVHLTDRGPRLAGPGRGTDAGDLWQALTVRTGTEHACTGAPQRACCATTSGWQTPHRRA
ncbi:hypothetical protein [Streptomyces sp. NPDC008001]|uniref:hypothetical protein n=1 Tax=Streptomyces sp. NPDC008001 TaxID=3364804 RepID=UPI0036E7D1A2